MLPQADPAARQFGDSQPLHVRIFFEHQGQYWLNPQGAGKRTSFEDYLATETQRGYTLKSLTGIVNDTRKIRVITQHNPTEAAKFARHDPEGNPLSPVNLAVFEEREHIYAGVEGPFHRKSLDSYLATQAQAGYHLKQAAGLVEDSPETSSRKIRVRTEVSPARTAPNRPRSKPNSNGFRRFS